MTCDCDHHETCAVCVPSLHGKPPTKAEIAAHLRDLARRMDDASVMMDYYGGLSGWAKHGREIAGAGNIARQWADEIDAQESIDK